MKIETEHYTIILGDARDELGAICDVDLCVTDAPYLLTSGGSNTDNPDCIRLRKSLGEEYNNSGHLFEGDCLSWEEIMPPIFNCLREDAHFYSMADSKNQLEMQVQALAAGFRFHNLLYWDKGTMTPNRWYMKNAEYVGLFYKGKAFSINDCSNKQGIYLPHRDETVHPTEKPVALMKHYIANSSQPGECVIDPFMGTGSTGVAAIQSGRRFIGIERDQRWFDVARARLEASVQDISKQTMDFFTV